MPRCLHTLGLFLERVSTRVAEKLQIHVLHLGARTQIHSHARGSVMAHFPLASVPLGWTHTNSNLSMFQKAFWDEYDISDVAHSKKSFCSHPKAVGAEHSWEWLKKKKRKLPGWSRAEAGALRTPTLRPILVSKFSGHHRLRSNLGRKNTMSRFPSNWKQKSKSIFELIN